MWILHALDELPPFLSPMLGFSFKSRDELTGFLGFYKKMVLFWRRSCISFMSTDPKHFMARILSLSCFLVFLCLPCFLQGQGMLPYFANFRLLAEFSTPCVNQRYVLAYLTTRVSGQLVFKVFQRCTCLYKATFLDCTNQTVSICICPILCSDSLNCCYNRKHTKLQLSLSGF